MKHYLERLYGNSTGGIRPGFAGFGLLLATMPFGLRLNAAMAGLMVLGWLLERGWQRIAQLGAIRWWVLAAMAFFALHVASFAWSDNVDAARFAIEKKLGLLLLPLVIATLPQRANDFRVLAQHLLAGIVVALLWCWLLALTLAALKGQLPTYHEFAAPLGAHAGYTSFLALAALIICLPISSRQPLPLKAWPFQAGFVLLIMASLVALASKLLLAVALLYLLLWAFVALKKSGASTMWQWASAAGLSIALLLVVSQTPVSERYAEMQEGGLEVLQQEQFAYDTPLNGFNLRVLYWRLAGEILDQENAWLAGVGVGDDQDLLDQRYRDLGIYTGNPDLNDTGYLGYNFHNQLLQSTVQLGIAGLLCLILLITLLWRAAVNTNYVGGLVLIACLCLFLLVESAFERQRGLFFIVALAGLIQAHHKSISS